MDDDQLLARIAHERERAPDGGARVIDLTATPPGGVPRLSALLEEATRRGL